MTGSIPKKKPRAGANRDRGKADPEIVSKGDQRGNVRLSQAVFIKRYGAGGRAENVSKLFLTEIVCGAKFF